MGTLALFRSPQHTNPTFCATPTRTQHSSYTMAANVIKSALAEHAVVVFSKSYCPFCTRVKQLFAKLGVSAHVVELDNRKDGSEIQNELAAQTGQRSVPNVFISGKHVGGCDDTMGAHSSGNLETMLKAAGAL